jgi:hypothetical protein
MPGPLLIEVEVQRYISVETLRLTKNKLEDYIKKTAAAAPGRALATALFDGI